MRKATAPFLALVASSRYLLFSAYMLVKLFLGGVLHGLEGWVKAGEVCGGQYTDEAVAVSHKLVAGNSFPKVGFLNKVRCAGY